LIKARDNAHQHYFGSMAMPEVECPLMCFILMPTQAEYVNANEGGCLSYMLSTGEENPDSLLIFERYVHPLDVLLLCCLPVPLAVFCSRDKQQ